MNTKYYKIVRNKRITVEKIVSKREINQKDIIVEIGALQKLDRCGT